MSSWAERVHRRAADLSSVVTLCGHPGSSATAYPYRLEKVKFGVLLEEVCKSNDNIPGPLLVLILKLNKESPNRRDVFRAPGHQGAMKKLIHFLQAGRLVNVDNYSVYTIASVLKKFLRKIPYGIFGRTGEKELFEIIELENETEQTERLHRLFTSLPKYTQHLLVLLFGTFRVIASNAVHAGTGMTSEAIGVSVAPSFFQSCVSDGKTARMEDVLKFKVATKIVKHVIDRFATNDIFGRENYEYYARVTGRILKVQDEWICSFQYPPPPREKLAQQKYALQHSLEAEKTWLQCQCERWGSLAQEESRSTPALLTSSSSALDNSVISLGLTPEHSLFESCARLSVSLEGPGLFVLTSSPVSKSGKHGSLYNDFGNVEDDGDDEDDDEGDDDELDGFIHMSTNSKNSPSHYQNVWDHSEGTDKIGFVPQSEHLHTSNSDDVHHHHHHHQNQHLNQNCSGGSRVAMCTKKKSKKVRNANCMSAAAATTATTATAVAINASLIGSVNLMRDLANDDTSASASASATMLNKSFEQFDYIDKCCDSSDLMAVKRRYRQNKQKKITQRLQYPRRSRVSSKNQDGCEHNGTVTTTATATTTTTTSDSNTNINNLNRDSKQIVDAKTTNNIFMIKSSKTPISSTATTATTKAKTIATTSTTNTNSKNNSKYIASACNSNILNNSGYCSRCYNRGLRYSSICSTRSTNNESYDHKATDNLTMTELHAINHYAWSAKSLSYLPQVRDDYLLASRISV